VRGVRGSAGAGGTVTVSWLLVPFKEALVVGVQGGQVLRCKLSTVQRVRVDALATSGGSLYAYANRITGEVVQSSRVDHLVERWMGDLDAITQMDQQMRRIVEAVVEERGDREVDDGHG